MIFHYRQIVDKSMNGIPYFAVIQSRIEYVFGILNFVLLSLVPCCKAVVEKTTEYVGNHCQRALATFLL